MTEDLYSLWLGLAAGPRPPDHYALLGVPKFSDDLPAIEAATRRKLRQLDKYAVHPDRAKRGACAALMNEVAKARVCLTHADRKRAYDESLGRDWPVAADDLPVLEAVQSPPAAWTIAKVWAEFQEEVRRHLHQWVLNDHEMRLLLATADSMGLDQRAARRMIRRIDAEADEAAQRVGRRWNYVLVGGAVIVPLVVLAVIFAPAWLRSPGDWFRSAPPAPVVAVANRPAPQPAPADGPAAMAAMQDRIRQTLAARRYSEVPALVGKLRAMGGAVEAEGLVGPHVAGLRGQLTAQLDGGRWTDAVRTAGDLAALRPGDPSATGPVARKTASLVASALSSTDASAARRDVAAALALSPADGGALSAARAIARRFGDRAAAGPATREVAATTSPTGEHPSTVPAVAVKAPTPAPLDPPRPRPGEVTLDLGGGVSLKLARIPSGRFTLGSPDDEKGHRANEGRRGVLIPRPFYMGVFEVTQEQYEQVMGKNPSRFKGAQNPVDNVGWNDAAEFCRKLSQRTGRMVALPSEAAWEYACRAGSTTRFGFGDSDTDTGDHAWYIANSDRKAHAVGGKRPNAFGLYDMHGNVWEWCSDRYEETYPHGGPAGFGGKAADGQDPLSAAPRVLRGGSWVCEPAFCRSACRDKSAPAVGIFDFGFRVAVDAIAIYLGAPPVAVVPPVPVPPAAPIGAPRLVRPRSVRGTVVKVAANSLVIQATTARPGADRAETTVATDEKTVVTLDSRPARLADLKESMTVTVMPTAGGADAPAARIYARSPRGRIPVPGGGPLD